MDSAPINKSNIMSRSLIQQLLQIGCVEVQPGPLSCVEEDDEKPPPIEI